jgi:hypothetical protein
MREALFIYPGTEPGRIAAEALLDKLNNPGGELTATLSSRLLINARISFAYGSSQ